ncbi:MAG: ankyrin repeat domain-containing protein [Rickettsiales endosymbiont of Dermacentor nuttalli]
MPLHCAVIDSRIDIVEVLLEFITNIDAQDTDNKTPLHYVIINKNRYIVELLLKNNAHVEFKDKDVDTPLHHIARVGSVSITNITSYILCSYSLNKE